MDRNKTIFFLRNSWGDSWGHKGDAYFDWETYKPSISEVWVSIDIDNSLLENVHELPAHQLLTRYLVYGMWGDDVKRVQKALEVTPVSGWFGPKTMEAVKKFQRENGIDAIGQIGPITLKALNEKYFN